MNYSAAIRCILLGCICGAAQGGVIFSASGLSGGVRWDAAPRTDSGNERSLDGGLRYSVSGGSYQAFRDSFSWTTTPSVEQFQQAVEQAFAAWTAVDPVSGLGTSISFVPDFGTPVVGGSSFGDLNRNGAEIDLVASNAGDGGFRAFTSIQPVASPVTLTSGVANYPGTQAIVGVDLHINNHPNAVYTLDIFRRLLTHEIGHALGLNDVDTGGMFIDDNFSSADPLGTLTNSWAHLVNPLDPANSAGLSTFSVAAGNFATAGVNLLMESNGLGVGPGNPLSNLFPLTNDEYGTRQFLYPTLAAVPEPSASACILLACAGAWLRRRINVRRRAARGRPERL